MNNARQNSTVLGGAVETQHAAAKTLKKRNEPLGYDELKAELSVERAVMQEVIRGLKDNGVVNVTSLRTGERVYTVSEDTPVEEIYSE